MEYNFKEIEKKWQEAWKKEAIYQVSNSSEKPKFYVLDMFPYPSGAGLHVGHPLGYIASDICARYKRLKGFNVLHPMGFDSFGLPAEQYALETGQHPATTTERNIATFKSQLNKIGFCFDWSREVKTSDPEYYRWTQWIFLQLFKSWYNHGSDKAEPIETLINIFEKSGTADSALIAKHSFTAEEWNNFDKKRQQDILMDFRLAFSSYGEVNWCEALGTVLANDEVVNGVSERGGHPVEKKKMRQWYLRITDYADRLLKGLETVNFSDAMKEMQRNWIGKSEGAEVEFRLTANSSHKDEGDEKSLTPNPSHRGEGNKSFYYQTADKKFWPQLKDLSRENRKERTEAENILWQNLRNNKLNAKVRRQHVIDGFIIDFAFLHEHLLIEVDGGYHNDPDQKEYDEARTAFLKESGYRIIRFTNEEVENNISKVLAKIREELAVSSPLSPERGDGGEAKKNDEFSLTVYTTRPDTIFGVDFMVLAPEHELVNQITTDAQRSSIDEYLTYVKSRSDRERQAEVKQITGCFTGAYAVNPFDGKQIPIWIAEYVLAGYGTGAIMAVPCGDQRDFLFAKHFNIPITNIIGAHYNGQEANPTKEAVLENSGFLNGLLMKDAIGIAINKIEELGIGKRKINYRMRDAGFSRQRYWGEPFPIIWSDGIAIPLDEKELPLELPFVEKYGPGKEGEGPLSNLIDWVNLTPNPSPQVGGAMRETSTMPGYAGSSWYFLRYMDPHNNETFADRKATDYWNQVDVYVGGTEHAVGHLLYSRLWTKVLYDLGYISFDEPYKKLVNQGMIQGSSRFVYRVKDSNKFVSLGLKNNYETSQLHVDVNIVDGVELDIEAFKKSKPEYANAEFILEDGKYICGVETEKMSKSKYNTVNPNDLVDKYGADTFRMYEMFLGPVEQSKPWDTKGIEGVHRFLKKLWRLFYDDSSPLSTARGHEGEPRPIWTSSAPSPSGKAGDGATDAELKTLHKTIKKIEEDTERFSFNTAVSAFMVCVNELTDLKCHKKEILEPLLVLLTPYAPHIAEELYHALGNAESVLNASYPKLENKYLTESEKEYPISINGKLRATMVISLSATQPEVERLVLDNEIVQKWVEGKPVKKIIYVKNKMVNVVV
ncbi:MAG: leucine--tRNA ligase [Bacteroidetes bacterium]|nr:leucine--tRNA ligase [Bacteroidota bacterium]